MKVSFEEHDGLARVRLERPEKKNALTAAMLERLADIFAGVATRKGMRAIILSGAGTDFCAGTDIAELRALDAAGARRKAERGQEVCEIIESCGVPVIAAIDGAAAGGGFELALSCHLRIATERATFSLPETSLGVIPAYGGTQRLARATGTGRALAAMLAAESIRADEALHLGLLNRVVPQESLMREAESLARAIENASAPLAVRACLKAVTSGTRLPLAEGLKLEAELFAQLFATADVREGTRAFLEKRPPVFRGE